ncbi:MAG: hypothetical protein JSW29_06620, partial [Candidatus Bathyarchaeota archaeon]
MAVQKEKLFLVMGLQALGTSRLNGEDVSGRGVSGEMTVELRERLAGWFRWRLRCCYREIGCYLVLVFVFF